MMKKIYSCELCREKKDPEQLYGLHFSNLYEFKLTDARKTDGQHICLDCLRQLKKQLQEIDFA
jgi:hypothetical protein